MGNSPVVSRINALLAEKGIQKQDFYKNCGITSASYSLWNTGKTTPRMKNLEVIANYLNTTTDYLLTGLGQKEKLLVHVDEQGGNLSPAFFRLKQGLEPYDLSEDDADFLLEVYKAHIKKNR